MFRSSCAIVLVAAVATSGCKKDASTKAEQPVPKVTVIEAVKQPTQNFDEYIGRTEASESVEVRARVFGYLKSVEFKDGDYVEENQTLFKIEPDEYEAVHKQALSKIAIWEAKLELAKANFARDAKLVKTGAVSQEDYDESFAAVKEAEAAVISAKADADRAALDLKYTEIKAPIAGRIDETYVSKGNLLTGGVGSGTLLTRIVKEQPMYIYFDVDERSVLKYMAMRRTEQEKTPGSLRDLNVDCLVQLANETDFPHQGKLDFAANQIDRSTGTARLRGVFENNPRVMASGLFVRIRIPIGQPYDAVTIPERAIATDQSIKYVFVVGSDSTAERRTIEPGERRGEMRIVSKGLNPGDRVITRGLQRVKPGQKVEAQLDEAASAPATAAKPANANPQTAPTKES